MSKRKKCRYCQGTGTFWRQGKEVPCGMCNGTGEDKEEAQ